MVEYVKRFNKLFCGQSLSTQVFAQLVAGNV